MAIAIAGFLTTNAQGRQGLDFSSPHGRQLTKEYRCREFQGMKPLEANSLYEGSDLQKDLLENSKRGVTPSYTFRGVSGYDYLNGPNGSTWYYTMAVEIEFKPYLDNPPEYQWLGDEEIVGYTFTIYNEMFEKVGTIHDEITLEPNEKWEEVRCRDIWLDPAVSQHFFNNDDKYEVMVFHAINIRIKDYLPGNGSYSYANRYYQKVYSIGGEKEGGNDKPINQIEGRCVDVTNVAAGSGEEEFYYTFIQDGRPDFTKFVVSPTDDNYVEHVKGLISPVTTYKKKADGDGIEEMYVFELHNAQLPHDTTDGIYLITKVKDGKGYFIYSQYEKPYFVNPLGGAIDESATPDNNFVITAYEMSGGEARLISETKIKVVDPMAAVPTPDKLIYAFYSIGSLTYRDDVDISGAFGSTEAPAYIVAHEVAQASNLEGGMAAFEVYDNQGNFKHYIARDARGVSILDTTEDGPIAMLVKTDFNDNITFEFRNLYTDKTLATVSQFNGGDPLSAAVALRKLEDGGYMYAFGMMYWEATDARGNDHARVQWFTKDGKKDHLDRINLGQGAERAQINITNLSMNPYLYDTDDQMEYAVLVSRRYGDLNREEFIIVDDSGEWYAVFSADDGKGDPRLFSLIPGDAKNPNRLLMAYSGGTVDIYDLPFDAEERFEPTAVETILEDGGNVGGIRLEGEFVVCEGALIELYNADGLKIGSARDFLCVSGFGKGVYMVTATDAAGARTSTKIYKK